MSKKNSITYIKPEEPNFLKRLKAEIGYKEGPTVDTKRELPTYDDSIEDNADLDDAPQVVVLKPGDLTAEEVAVEKDILQKAEENKPADLTQRVLFRPVKKGEKSDNSQKRQTDTQDNPESCKKKRKESKKSAPVLSFDVDED